MGVAPASAGEPRFDNADLSVYFSLYINVSYSVMSNGQFATTVAREMKHACTVGQVLTFLRKNRHDDQGGQCCLQQQSKVPQYQSHRALSLTIEVHQTIFQRPHLH